MEEQGRERGEGRVEEGKGGNGGRGLPSVPQFQICHYTTARQITVNTAIENQMYKNKIYCSNYVI